MHPEARAEISVATVRGSLSKGHKPSSDLLICQDVESGLKNLIDGLLGELVHSLYRLSIISMNADGEDDREY